MTLTELITVLVDLDLADPTNAAKTVFVERDETGLWWLILEPRPGAPRLMGPRVP